MDKIPVLLLAAGESRRMGQPKSLLQWGDKNLIQHQISNLKKLKQPIYVVLGAYSEEIFLSIKGLKVEIIVNQKWEQGMGSSISFGINEIERKEVNAQAVLIVLVDQPLLTNKHLKTLINTFRTTNYKCVVSESDNGWKGVPVVFDKCYFSSLKELNGKQGAKQLFDLENELTTSINAGNSLSDIDTMDDYESLHQLFF